MADARDAYRQYILTFMSMAVATNNMEAAVRYSAVAANLARALDAFPADEPIPDDELPDGGGGLLDGLL